MPIGWERIEAAWWFMIADGLAKPWPREAVLMDLRWWAGQEKQGRMARPGRAVLKARWGWDTDWSVRAVIAAGEWEDAHKTDSASPPPARRQPAAPRAYSRCTIHVTPNNSRALTRPLLLMRRRRLARSTWKASILQNYSPMEMTMERPRISMREEVQKAREMIGPVEDPFLDIPLSHPKVPSFRVVEQRWLQSQGTWVTTRVIKEGPPQV